MANVSVGSSSKATWWTKCIYFMQLLDSLYSMLYLALVSLFSTGWLSSVCEGENKIHNLNRTGKKSQKSIKLFISSQAQYIAVKKTPMNFITSIWRLILSRHCP